jgi:hypothetical protein
MHMSNIWIVSFLLVVLGVAVWQGATFLLAAIVALLLYRLKWFLARRDYRARHEAGRGVSDGLGSSTERRDDDYDVS